MATKTRVSMQLEVGDRLAEPKGGYRIRMARGESESVEVSAELLDGGRPFDASGLSARFMAVLAGGRHVAMPVPPEGVSGGTLTYTLPSGLGATPGDTRLAVFELSDGEGYRIYTDPFTVSVADGPSPTSAEIGPYVPELDALLAQLKAAIGSAGDAAGTASSAAAKAEAAAAEANDAAAKAEAAIAEVKATEAKLYPAAENILVGGESGAVAHVDDAFNGASLRKIVVEGAVKQDGIPSPESPKPITVVENPTVKMTGKNILKYPFEYHHEKQELINGIKYTDNGDGSISIEGTSTSSSFYNLDFTSNAKQLVGKTICIPEIASESNVNFAVSVFFENGAYDVVLSSTSKITKAKVPENAVKLRVYIGVANSKTVNTTIWPSICIADEDGKFTKYASQEQAFTLPAEHPYLAKLPDGTADEIVVDKEGNVELVARVSKASISAAAIVNTWGKGYAIYDWPKDGRYLPNASCDGTAVACDVLKAETGSNIYRGLGVGISVGSTIANTHNCTTVLALGDGVDLSSIDGASFYYPVMTPVRYQLGKIDMPKSQDSIINVWTDAEVTPNTSIEYVRDVNIVVANLESAIASIS